MPIIDQASLDEWFKNNTDPYGKCICEVAKRAMEILDEDQTPLHNGYHPDIHTAHGILCKADKDIKAGGITGCMAGCAAQMVVKCHSRGEEFRRSHNGEEYQGEGTVNHAFITLDTEKLKAGVV